MQFGFVFMSGIFYAQSEKTDRGPLDIQRTRRDQQNPSRHTQNRTGQEPINGLSIDTLHDNMTRVVVSTLWYYFCNFFVSFFGFECS